MSIHDFITSYITLKRGPDKTTGLGAAVLESLRPWHDGCNVGIDASKIEGIKSDVHIPSIGTGPHY